MVNLDSLRHDINEIDEALQRLLCQRFALTDQVGAYKKAHHMEVLDEKREEAIYHRIEENYPEEAQSLIEIYRAIMAQSKERQRKI